MRKFRWCWGWVLSFRAKGDFLFYFFSILWSSITIKRPESEEVGNTQFHTAQSGVKYGL